MTLPDKIPTRLDNLVLKTRSILCFFGSRFERYASAPRHQKDLGDIEWLVEHASGGGWYWRKSALTPAWHALQNQG